MEAEILAVHALKSDDLDEIDKAFCYLYDKYCRLVYTCIRAIVIDHRDAEELTDDTFIKVFNNRKTLCEQKNIKYYLVTIAKHAAIDFLKRKHMDIVLDEDFIYDCVQSDCQQEWVNIKNEINKYLSKEDTEIILSHIVFGETFQSIANYYKKSIHTIKTKYFRGIKKLQKKMRNNNDETSN